MGFRDVFGVIQRTVVNPFSQTTRGLRLVQGNDYTLGSRNGALVFPITGQNVVEGDVAEFGAQRSNEPDIYATGEVVTISGELFAQIELTKELHTNRNPANNWRYEVRVVDTNGDISSIIADSSMQIVTQRTYSE